MFKRSITTTLALALALGATTAKADESFGPAHADSVRVVGTDYTKADLNDWAALSTNHGKHLQIGTSAVSCRGLNPGTLIVRQDSNRKVAIGYCGGAKRVAKRVTPSGIHLVLSVRAFSDATGFGPSQEVPVFVSLVNLPVGTRTLFAFDPSKGWEDGDGT